jgi:excisionase family DNA binding protein
MANQRGSSHSPFDEEEVIRAFALVGEFVGRYALAIARASDAAPEVRQHVTKRGFSGPEAAKYLGISLSTLKNLVGSGKLKRTLRVGSKLLFDRRDLDRFLDAKQQGKRPK